MARITVVSGRMRVLFDLREIPVDESGELRVSSYVCKWCGFTAVVDEPALIPDHECHGPIAGRQ